jgi:hypothetical protein
LIEDNRLDLLKERRAINEIPARVFVGDNLNPVLDIVAISLTGITPSFKMMASLRLLW